MKEIRRIIGLYDQLAATATPAALAVVVDVEASSYRRIGARLLVAADGRYVGGISGGCLEGDALRRARAAILAGVPATHTYDTLDGDDAVIGIGLGCEGRIDVLFIPIDYADRDNEVEMLRLLVTTRVPVVTARLLSSSGGSALLHRPYPQNNLAPIVSHLSQSEETVAVLAQEVLAKGRSRRCLLTNKQGQSSYVLFEVFHPEVHLVVSGTNYDIPPTLAAAKQLGWQTTVIGPRRKFTAEINDLADRLLDYHEVDQCVPDTATAVVLMSHDYDWDKKMVAYFLPHTPVYFGMLGPRKRAIKMHQQLQEEGGPDLLGYSNLYAPVGLDIGAETPEEIAASLIAEIIAVLRGRDGKMLRLREGSIHGNYRD